MLVSRRLQREHPGLPPARAFGLLFVTARRSSNRGVLLRADFVEAPNRFFVCFGLTATQGEAHSELRHALEQAHSERAHAARGRNARLAGGQRLRPADAAFDELNAGGILSRHDWWWLSSLRPLGDAKDYQRVSAAHRISEARIRVLYQPGHRESRRRVARWGYTSASPRRATTTPSAPRYRRPSQERPSGELERATPVTRILVPLDGNAAAPDRCARGWNGRCASIHADQPGGGRRARRELYGSTDEPRFRKPQPAEHAFRAPEAAGASPHHRTRSVSIFPNAMVDPRATYRKEGGHVPFSPDAPAGDAPPWLWVGGLPGRRRRWSGAAGVVLFGRVARRRWWSSRAQGRRSQGSGVVIRTHHTSPSRGPAPDRLRPRRRRVVSLSLPITTPLPCERPSLCATSTTPSTAPPPNSTDAGSSRSTGAASPGNRRPTAKDGASPAGNHRRKWDMAASTISGSGSTWHSGNRRRNRVRWVW